LKAIPKGGRYTWEFRREAAKLAIEDKISCREAAQRLSPAPQHSLIGSKPIRKASWGEVKMERDILKKAAAYFARESLHGKRR